MKTKLTRLAIRFEGPIYSHQWSHFAPNEVNDLSTSCRVFLAVNFAYSNGGKWTWRRKNSFPTWVSPSASCFSSSKTLHSVDKAYILLYILQNMCKILVRMNNLSDFPGIFHFNSIFSSFFWFKLEFVATFAGKTTFSPLVWPCFQFSSEKWKNIEFQ